MGAAVVSGLDTFGNLAGRHQNLLFWTGQVPFLETSGLGVADGAWMGTSESVAALVRARGV